MKKNVTLKDIAKELGLTVNSVSRALHDSKEISEATKQQVKEVAARLGYVPNIVASSLRNGKTNIIAIVFDNMINPYFSIMTEKIQIEVKKHGYDTMIFTTIEPVLSMEIFKYIYARKIDGIITFMQPSTDVLQLCKASSVPLIVLGRIVDDPLIDTITTNDYKGGYLACKALIEKGAKKLGYIGASFSVDCSNRRLEGFKQCALDNKIALNDEDILFVQLGYQSRKQIIGDFTKTHDGVFCFNDMIAYEVYSYCEAIGTKVVGYDNIQHELFSVNRLTTISADKDEIVNEVVMQLLAKIDDETKPTLHKEFDVMLQYGKSC